MIEIEPISKLDSEVTVPGSKYIANRVLLLAALANGISKISNVPDNEDINATMEALRKFDIKINKKNAEIIINGSNGNVAAPNEKIDVRNSGTLMRLITGFASLAGGKTTITGSERIKQRPIKDLLKSINDLRYSYRYLHSDDFKRENPDKILIVLDEMIKFAENSIK